MNDQTMNNGGADNAPAQQPENNALQQAQKADVPAAQREAGERPIRTIRDGGISASVWEHQGDEGPYYSAKGVRKWRDENGQFHESNSYSEYDLLRLADLARNTSDVIEGLRQTRQRAQDQTPEQSQDPPAPAQDKDQSRNAYIEERQAQQPAQAPAQSKTHKGFVQ